MPPHLHKKWPYSFGFEIYGNGPCFVTSVEKGSVAHKAGLLPGDQLLEINGQDVTKMSVEQIRALVKAESNHPPELEVVSCIKTHVIKPDHPLGYGFRVLNKRPVSVESVDYGGPAYQSGLRVGDIILEVSSPKLASLNTLGTVLSQKPGKLTIQTIPVTQTSNMVQVDKTLSRVSSPDPRLFKAKDLHTRLENLMGNDHRRKMAVVTALKQYAEDRDIAILCSALGDTLRTPAQRKILTQIRQLIPPAQRPHFDDLLNFSRLREMPVSNYHPRTAHHIGRRKLIQVVREADSFGFVIKSSSPAYIESVDRGGAADKAGILPGDYLIKVNGIDIRKCGHDRLVQLIQDSGSAPTFEVLRCGKPGNPNMVQSSSSSSSSSHDSFNGSLFSNIMTDKEGNTFLEKANFLLTSKEWKAMKTAIRSYDKNRDVTRLYKSVSVLLDNPSKKTLWPFLFVILSSSHREYVSHHVNIPVEDMMNVVKSGDSHHSPDIVGDKMDLQDIDLNDFPPSFKQQTDFLLTSRERLQLKKCLKEYSSNHDLSSLIKTLESILDTPSKKILWKMVLTQLTEDDREVMKEKLVLHDQKTLSAPLSLTNMDSYIGPTAGNESAQIDIATNTEADILYGRNKPHFHRSSESSSDERESSDSSDSLSTNRKLSVAKFRPEHSSSFTVKEHKDEEIKKIIQYMQNALEAEEEYTAAETADGSSTTDENQDDIDDHRYVTIIPVGYPGLEEKLPFYNRKMSSPQLSNLRKNVFSSSKDAGQPEADDTSISPFDTHHDDVSNSSDNDSDKGVEVVYDLTDSKYSRMTHNAKSASEQPNDPEVSGRSLVHSSHANVSFDVPNSDDFEGELKSEKENNKLHSLPPPPPPPPPLSDAGLGLRESPSRMSVKRINWEKLDNKSVQNTIWEKLNDQDLDDVVRYLELETRFSTKPSHQKDHERRKEIQIMDKKKAYNISILLGHLKMSIADMKKALYNMDEKTLSPELLGQLLAFVPSEQEVSQYRLYTGDISLLTKPDQFAYQISLVDNYEERLKALRFKATFKEKVEEIRKNLMDIRTASLELRMSKKLAQLLEIILAMGNYMNKGNARVGEAAGFRITFLTQLDVTKTADKKSSFLHVVADTAYNKFPDILALGDDLATVDKAARVSIKTLIQDIQDLQTAIQETSAVLERISNHAQNSQPGDQFEEVMSHFITAASDEIQSILTLQASSMTEFAKTVTFFGEDPKILNAHDVFGIFSEFIKNFEKAHRHNLLFG